MFRTIKKVFFALALIVTIAFSSVLQNSNSVSAAAGTPKTPLAPWLTWNDLGETTRNIQLNISGDALALSGHGYQAAEKFVNGITPEVDDFYSNVALYKSDWVSDNAFEDETGTHLVFFHESGVYLAIDKITCADDPSAMCLVVWKSASKETGTLIQGLFAKPAEFSPSAIFGKKTPVNNSTGINPTSAYLSWSAYTGTPVVQVYSYCVKVDLACTTNDPNWTRTALNKSITLSQLNPNKTYYWQVKAIYDANSVPKKFVLADGGSTWKFTTSTGSIRITGNAGGSGVTMSWTDTSSHTTTSDSNGDYVVTVPYNYQTSITVTPSKNGYSFTPANRSYLALTSNQTFQNYIATYGFPISGNAGVGGAVMYYTDGSAKNVTATAAGNYSVAVSNGWTGTITPVKAGYTFDPVSRTYSTPVLTEYILQNFNATQIYYTITGDAGVAGATLSYTDGSAKTVTADAVTGLYTISVPYNWSGKITPSKSGVFSFTPAYQTYTSVKANMSAQDYLANYKLVFTSIATDDGYIQESTQTSEVGGVMNSSADTILVGDTILNQQLRGILSFDTSTLPADAILSSAKVMLNKQSMVGSNTMTVLGALYFETMTPYFGSSSALELVDFNNAFLGAGPSGTIGKTPVGTVFSGNFSVPALSLINPTGLTQLRLRFNLADNGNKAANNMRFYSGNYSSAAKRPFLEILYRLP